MQQKIYSLLPSKGMYESTYTSRCCYWANITWWTWSKIQIKNANKYDRLLFNDNFVQFPTINRTTILIQFY